MRLFALRVTAFLAVQALVAAVLFGLYLRTGDAAHSYLAAYADKAALLEGGDGPKLVVVGGSNVALGFDSPAAAAALPHRPVNMGLMTGIGTPMMLARVEPHLQPGDVVLLSLEYERFLHKLEAPTVFRLLEEHPAAWRDIPAGYLPVLLDDAFPYVGQALRSMLGRGGRARTHAPPYDRHGFNRFGDFHGHYGLPRSDRLQGALVVPALSEDGLRDAVVTLNAFHQRAQRAGVTVLLTFPPLPRDVYRTRAADLQLLHAHLERELTIPLLDRPADMAMPRELFFDTIYHLNRAGTERRMRSIVARMAAAFPTLAAQGQRSSGASRPLGPSQRVQAAVDPAKHHVEGQRHRAGAGTTLRAGSRQAVR